MKVEQKIANIYHSPSHPAGYGGARRLKGSLPKTTRKTDIQNWLSGQESYTLHKNVTYRFPRRRVVVGGIDHQWQADLIDVSAYSKHNNDVKFLLTVTDVFSKFTWVRPLKSKSANDVCDAFETIFQSNRKPSTIQTDKGREFFNVKVQGLNLLPSYHTHFNTVSILYQ